jgi:serine/threonine-protein kinase
MHASAELIAGGLLAPGHAAVVEPMNCPVCGEENGTGARFCSRCGAALQLPAEGSLVGRLLGGRYRVVRLIAEGGMGAVYEAEQQMGPHVRPVAIKTLLPELSTDSAVVSRFHRECGIVAELEHPNTIKFYDFGTTPEGELYIAMEFVRGESLSDVIERGPMASQRVLSILRQICGALHEAHEKGIVHRDLKPDNIVLMARGADDDFVKLLDFGIAARMGAEADGKTKLTQLGAVLGTPPYMSPEQLSGEKVDRRSDLYSLGIIAYEMLTGHKPFDADSPWGWAHQHMTQPPRPLRDFAPAQPIPSALERAILRVLAKDRRHRPSTALEFWQELSGDPASLSARQPHTQPEVTDPGTSLMPHAPAAVVLRDRTELPAAAPFTPAPAVLGGYGPVLARRRRRRWPWAAATLLVLSGGAAATVASGVLGRATAPEMPSLPLDPAPSADPASAQLTPLSDPIFDDAPTAWRETIRETRPRSSGQATTPRAEAPPVATSVPPVVAAPPPVVTSPPPVVTPPPAQTATPPAAEAPRAPAPLPSGPGGDAACQQSKALATSGDIEGAASLLNRCSSNGGSPAAQAEARARIQTHAPAEVRRRAFRQDCAGARSAVAAATSVGAGARAQAALNGTSCAG